MAEVHGGLVSTHGMGGSFTCKGFEGTYAIEDGQTRVTISAKPFYLSWSIIDTKLKTIL